ncbi:MAG: hypothetical protein ABI589_01345 [Burkholderiales bacterium]
MSASWLKWLLLVAAAWNIIGGASALLDPSQHFAQLYSGSLNLGDPIQLFFYRCTWINVIGWGLAYLLAALRPAMCMPVLIAGAIGKTAYFAASFALFSSGLGNRLLLAAGGFDLVLAALFLFAALWPRKAAAA